MAKGDRPKTVTKTVTDYAAYGRYVAEATRKVASIDDLYNKVINDGMNMDYREIQNMEQLVKFLDGQSVIQVVNDASHKFSPSIHNPKSVYDGMPRLTKDGSISIPYTDLHTAHVSRAGLNIINEDARLNIRGDLSVKTTTRGNKIITKYTLPTGFSFVFADGKIKEAKNRKKK